MPAADDWRRIDQEHDLPPGTTLARKGYRAHSKTWDHEHCIFCSAKFMDPDFSELHRQFIADNPDVLTEGYTTTDEYEQGAGWHWVCAECFADFAEEFHWRS